VCCFLGGGGGGGNPVTDHKKCVLNFSTALSGTTVNLRRNERDMTKIRIGLHVQYALFFSEFNET